MHALCIVELRMKRWRLILGIAGVVLLIIGATFVRRSSLPRANALIVAASCNMPATILEPPAGVRPVGTAILLHGLGANRRTMNYLGADFAGHGLHTYLLDLPGHGDNKDSFSFAKAETCANATIESLIRGRKIDPATTILVGHSMGGSDRHSYGGPRACRGNNCDFPSADGAAAAHAREFADIQRRIRLVAHEAASERSRCGRRR